MISGSFHRFLLLGLLTVGLAGPASAADQLAVGGKRLDDMAFAAGPVKITRDIALGGDRPLSTHVMARFSSGPMYQRLPTGKFVAWDGRTESLVDDGFGGAGGVISFKVYEGDLRNESLPILFTVAYRTEAGLKYGAFQVSTKAVP